MMKLSQIASAVVLAGGAMLAGQASAASICNNCEFFAAGAAAGTYIGSHDSRDADTSGFRHSQMWVPVATAFNDVWVFDLQPVGAQAQVNANFIPISPTAFSGFSVAIREVLSFSGDCGTTLANAAGTLGNCSSVVLGATLASSVNSGANADVFPVALMAGRYAFQVSGTLNALGTTSTGALRFAQYSGQLTTSELPEPGSLALVGLALVGAAVGAKRSRKA
jgi:PEP-CTERM motif